MGLPALYAVLRKFLRTAVWCTVNFVFAADKKVTREFHG